MNIEHNARDKLRKLLPLPIRFILIYSVFVFIFTSLKFTANMPRPFCENVLYQIISAASFTDRYCYTSFPSAHTGLSIMFAYFLWNKAGAILKFLSILLIIMVAISRITLAMHYPSDIVVAIPLAIFSIFLGELFWYLYKKIVARI